ncbi:MAG: CHASE3 domain-containing protein, partial [Candidatus Rokuibacteriota bacterium]
MGWILTRGQTVAVALLAAALLIDGALTVHNIREVANGVRWVSHTHEVLAKLEEVLSTLKDAENGQRGYLLTGERPYLEPYEQAVARVQTQLVQLRQLTLDNPVQTAHALQLGQLAAERLGLLRQGLDRFRAESDRVRALRMSGQYLLEGEGKRAMDLIRDEVYGMKALERDLLRRREAASHANARVALATTVVALSLGLLLIAMVIWLFARNLATRQRAADVMHAERERFRTTLTSIGDAVAVTDAQGRITLLNPVAQALTRWGEEAVGQPLETVFRIVNEATRQMVENPVSKVIRLGAIVGLANHTVLIAKDGAEAAIDD